jgi:hypothetical protein
MSHRQTRGRILVIHHLSDFVLLPVLVVVLCGGDCASRGTAVTTARVVGIAGASCGAVIATGIHVLDVNIIGMLVVGVRAQRVCYSQQKRKSNSVSTPPILKYYSGSNINSNILGTGVLW